MSDFFVFQGLGTILRLFQSSFLTRNKFMRVLAIVKCVYVTDIQVQ